MTVELPNISDAGSYSVTDVAKILQVARFTVNRWCASGQMRFRVGLNGRKKIKGSEIRRFYNIH